MSTMTYVTRGARRVIALAVSVSLTCGTLVLGPHATPLAHAQSGLSIGPESQYLTHAQLSAATPPLAGFPDDTMGCVSAGNGHVDCYSSNGGNGASPGTTATTKVSGTPDNPVQTVVYNSSSIAGIPPNTFGYANVGPVYRIDATRLIGFVHLERDPSTGGFWGSIGLVYSTDNGAMWTWENEIVQQNLSYSSVPVNCTCEVGNGAFALVNPNTGQVTTDPTSGDFYVYMEENHPFGMSVSRASAQAVINAVENGTALPMFYKYTGNGSWNAPAAWINGAGGTPQGGSYANISDQIGTPDSIIWDGALGQFVMGLRDYSTSINQAALLTSANPVDFSVSDGATKYLVSSSNAEAYPSLIGDPNNPELQANADGSFYLYYTSWPPGQGLFNSGTYIGKRLITLGTTSSNTVNDTGLSYSGGGWYYSTTNASTYYNGDFHSTPNNGDSVSYTFTGIGVSYISGTGPDRGNVDVYIDGQYQTTVNAYASAYASQQVLYSVSGLSNGSHTIELVKHDGSYMLVDDLAIQTVGSTVNDTGLSYSGGGWYYSTTNASTYYNGDFHSTPNNGDSVSYTFTGIGVSYISGTGPDRGNVDVYIDGQYQTTVNAYASAYASQQVLYSVSGLSNGSHTIELVKHDGSYMLVDDLAVQS